MIKDMFGKLQLVIGAKDLVVPFAVEIGFVMITVYKPSTPSYLNNGTLLRMGVLPQRTLLWGQEKRYGGFAIRVMSGKLQLPVEIREQDVPIVLDRQYVGITLCRPLTLSYPGNGTVGKTAL